MPRLGTGVHSYTVTIHNHETGRAETQVRYQFRARGTRPDGNKFKVAKGGYLDARTCEMDRIATIKSEQAGEHGKKVERNRALFDRTVGELIFDFRTERIYPVILHKRIPSADKFEQFLRTFTKREPARVKKLGGLSVEDWQDYCDRRLLNDK